MTKAEKLLWEADDRPNIPGFNPNSPNPSGVGKDIELPDQLKRGLPYVISGNIISGKYYAKDGTFVVHIPLEYFDPDADHIRKLLKMNMVKIGLGTTGSHPSIKVSFKVDKPEMQGGLGKPYGTGSGNAS